MTICISTYKDDRELWWPKVPAKKKNCKGGAMVVNKKHPTLAAITVST